MSSFQPLCCYCHILPFTYGYKTHNMSLFFFKLSIIFKGGLNNKKNIIYFLMSSAALFSPILGPTNSSCLRLPRLETILSIQGGWTLFLHHIPETVFWYANFCFVSLNIRNHSVRIERFWIIFSSRMNIFFSFCWSVRIKTD